MQKLTAKNKCEHQETVTRQTEYHIFNELFTFLKCFIPLLWNTGILKTLNQKTHKLSGKLMLQNSKPKCKLCALIKFALAYVGVYVSVVCVDA